MLIVGCGFNLNEPHASLHCFHDEIRNINHNAQFSSASGELSPFSRPLMCVDPNGAATRLRRPKCLSNRRPLSLQPRCKGNRNRPQTEETQCSHRSNRRAKLCPNSKTLTTRPPLVERCMHTEGKANGDLLMGADAIASFLGISRRQAYRLIHDHLIPSFKLGGTVAARRSSLTAMLEKLEQNGSGQTH